MFFFFFVRIQLFSVAFILFFSPKVFPLSFDPYCPQPNMLLKEFRESLIVPLAAPILPDSCPPATGPLMYYRLNGGLLFGSDTGHVPIQTEEIYRRQEREGTAGM